MRADYDFNRQDRFLQAYKLSFDASIRWIFIPLLSGGTVYIPQRQMPLQLEVMRLLIEERLTVCMLLPSLLRLMQPYFKEMLLPELRWSISGGEALHKSLFLQWTEVAERAVFETYYGPTELTQSCFRYRWRKGEQLRSRNGVVSIGKLHAGHQSFLKDSGYEDAKELCVKGPQVFKGYLGSTDSTDKNGYYCTGDLVDVDEEGYYYFKGRNDTQLKVNGYRIQAQEVEEAILQISNANRVAVVKEADAGREYLVAYIDRDMGNTAILIAALKKVLPQYMLPEKFITPGEWPYLANGKLDRKALERMGCV